MDRSCWRYWLDTHHRGILQSPVDLPRIPRQDRKPHRCILFRFPPALMDMNFCNLLFQRTEGAGQEVVTRLVTFHKLNVRLDRPSVHLSPR